MLASPSLPLARDRPACRPLSPPQTPGSTTVTDLVRIGNATPVPALPRLPAAPVGGTCGTDPVALNAHDRYLRAQRLLDAPLARDDRDSPHPPLSRQEALCRVMLGTDAGDAQARTALLLSVLPWERVTQAFGSDPVDPRAAELTLVLMLQRLFGMTGAQGHRLWPLVKAHGRELSLAQWVLALARPRHQHHGMPKLDALPAVAARLKAQVPLARMDEASAEDLLLRTLLPAWGPASRAALAGQWRADREGWSLADAALRVRELTQHGQRRIEDALRALQAERARQRPPAPPAGRVAEAMAGILHLLFGQGPAALADRVMAANGMTPGLPGGRGVQHPSALDPIARGGGHAGMRLRLAALWNRTEATLAEKAFYRGEMRRIVEARMAEQPVSGGTTGNAPVPPSAASTAFAADTPSSALFTLPDPRDPPGGLTAMGILREGVGARPAAGVAAATLLPLARLDEAFTALHIDDTSITPTTPAATEAGADDGADLTDAEIADLRDHVPHWITQAPLEQQEVLQALLDAQVIRDEVLAAYVGSLESLYTYTGNRLAQALQHALPGHTVDPGNLTVTVTERTYPPADIPGGFFELPMFPQPRNGVEPIVTETSVSLVQFALDNAGPGWMLPPELTISGHGVDASGRTVTLDQDALVMLVRELDSGTAYQRYLKEQLTGSSNVRNAWVQSALAGLRVALQIARMSGMVFPPDFYNHLDAVNGQDFVSRMLDVVLGHPDAGKRPELESHPLQVMSLMIGFAADGSACRVNGLWLVGTADPQRGITDVVLLAPGVPDGKVIRVYTSLRDARSDPYWRSAEGYAWLKSHMSLDDQRRLQVVTQRPDPVRSRGPDSMAYFIADRMHFVPVGGHFMEQAYADHVDTMLKDADVLSTSSEAAAWKAALSFAVDKALLLADLGLLPSLRVLGRVARGLSTLGRSAVGGRKAIRSVERQVFNEVEPVRVKVDPPEPPPIRLEHEILLGSPPKEGVAELQQRMHALSSKAPTGLSIREQAELRLLKDEVPRLKAEIATQHAFVITANLAAWQDLMNGIPQLIGISDAGARQYLAYLLSQREGSVMKITKMLESLSKGVSRAPLPFRLLHERGLTMIDERLPPVPVQGLTKTGDSQSLPVPGHQEPGTSGQKSLPLPGKRMSDSAPGGSPSKRFAWSPQAVSPVKRNSIGIPQSPIKNSKGSGGLTMEGTLPAPIPGHAYLEQERSAWPTVLYHYTSRKNYDAIKATGAEFIQPSNRNPLGLVSNGPPPRVVYVTTLPPGTGRRTLVTALFGRTQHPKDRTKKVECVIKMTPQKFPDGTRLIQYQDTDVWAVAAPGDGTLRLIDPDGTNSIWTKPAPGGEVVPM